MAIEKTALYNRQSSLSEWLKANALGIYFDEVEKDSYHVDCFCGGKNFISFTDELNSSYYGIQIETQNGSDLVTYSGLLKATGYAYG